MPLGYIALLSRKGKGCRCDEMKRKPTFFLRSRHGRHRTFFLWVLMMNVVHASFTERYDCKLRLCVCTINA